MQKREKLTKKYELLATDSIEVGSHKLHRIRALRDFGNVRCGDLGGYVETEDNLSHKGTAWVADDARVLDKGRVSEDGLVSGQAVVLGQARIFGNARVCGTARITDRAWIADFASVVDEAIVLSLIHI